MSPNFAYPREFKFSDDGLRFYARGGAAGRVFYRKLTTAYDITSAENDWEPKFMAATGTGSHVSNIHIGKNGTKFYQPDQAGSSIEEWDLKDPFNLGEGIENRKIYNTPPLFNDNEDFSFTAIQWSPDGAFLFALIQVAGLSNFIRLEATANSVATAQVRGPLLEAIVQTRVSTVSGANHLEKKLVTVLHDGFVTSLPVIDGSVTFPRTAARVHLGIPYCSLIETLDVETPGGGTIQGKTTKIPSVVLRFYRSDFPEVGRDFDDMVQMKTREQETFGEPTGLFTGDRRVVIPPAWKRNGRIAIRHCLPSPLTILAIIPDILVGDDDLEM